MSDTRLATTTARWTGIGLSTAPTERTEAAEAVVTAYTSVGLRPPAHIVWFASPAAGARAAALLTGCRGTPAAPVDPGDDIASALRDQGCAPTPGSAGVSVRSQVRTAPWATARREVNAALGPDGWARLWAACGADVRRAVEDRVAMPLRAHLRAELPDALRPVLLDAAGGQHDAGWLAAFDAALPRVSRPSTDPIEVAAAFDRDGFTGWTAPGAGAAVVQAAGRLAGLAGIARTAGWWWPYANVAILTDRPVELHRDHVGRLHAAVGPALRYADGFEVHAWHGMPILSTPAGTLSEDYSPLGQLSTGLA